LLGCLFYKYMDAFQHRFSFVVEVRLTLESEERAHGSPPGNAAACGCHPVVDQPHGRSHGSVACEGSPVWLKGVLYPGWWFLRILVSAL